jgi:hypothetical protein
MSLIVDVLGNFIAATTVWAGLLTALFLALAGAVWLGYQYGLRQARPAKGQVSASVGFGHETVPLEQHEDVLATVPIAVQVRR